MVFNGWSEREVRTTAASLASYSDHPVSLAIVNASADLKKQDVDSFEAIVGRGVHGAITGKDFYLGNLRLTEEHFNCPSEIKATVQRLESQGKNQLFYSMMVSKCLGCSLLLILLKTAAVKRLNNFMNLALKLLC